MVVSGEGGGGKRGASLLQVSCFLPHDRDHLTSCVHTLSEDRKWFFLINSFIFLKVRNLFLVLSRLGAAPV